MEKCIMPDNPPLWRNKRFSGSHRHEIFFGVKNRQKSIEDGLVVFLKPELHNMSKNGVHYNKNFDLMLKQRAEIVWCKYYCKTIDEFRERYGRNYV